MKAESCSDIAEEIAWGRKLTAETQEHVLSCKQCGDLFEEFAKLESLLNPVCDEFVPIGFVNRVMNQIEGKNSFNFGWLLYYFELRVVRVGLVIGVFLWPTLI